MNQQGLRWTALQMIDQGLFFFEAPLVLQIKSF